jgi:hypothetical protein
MADISSSILNLGAGVLAGIVTGAVSVRFALRRFREERTWDRKVAAYTEIFDALYDIQRYATMRVEEIEEGASFVEEYAEEASRRSSSGFDVIRRAAIRGTFVVGPAAAARLEQLVAVFDDPHHGDDPHERIWTDLEASRKALTDLRGIANADVYETDAFDRSRIGRYVLGWSSTSREVALPGERQSD